MREKISVFIFLNNLVDHSAAWKAPINLTQEAHERLKRSLTEPPPAPKTKKKRTVPPLEEIPESIVCNELPRSDCIPKVSFSQVDNKEGLHRAVT